MEGGEGMVAVVRGLRDSGLAVTLLDGSRQYTLMPNAEKNPSSSHVHVTQRVCARAQTDESFEQPSRSDSAAQATDGRYASMYKMAHCNMSPTSPPVHLTEFPPQRAEVCRGHGNFEVGGHGSGENYSPRRSSGSFRGAMSWPDRGSVCSPRPSREPDAFANSLRKYPSMSIEKSTEMVERLISYTQTKNMSKSSQNRSPSRNGTDSNSSNQLFLDQNTSRNTVPRNGSYQKSSYEPEVNISKKAKPRLEESPTRDNIRNESEFADYRRQVMRPHSRCLKDFPRKVKDNVRSVSCYPYHQPVVSPVIRQTCDQNINLSGHKSPSLLTTTNSVNMEVQAAAEMISKEVETLPRSVPIQRTVAVPLSPTSSSYEQKPEGEALDRHHSKLNHSPSIYKYEPTSMPVELSIKAPSRSNDEESLPHNCPCFIIQRKNKSDEYFQKDFRNEIYELLEKVSVCPNTDPRAYDLRRKVLKQMSTKLQQMAKSINFNDGTENTKEHIRNLLMFVPLWVPCGDIQTYREAITDEIINRINRYKSYSMKKSETYFDITNEERKLDEVLRNWICKIPLKSLDLFGKPLDKENITEIVLKRLKKLIHSRPKSNERVSLIPEILKIVYKLPIAVNIITKPEYLNILADALLNELVSEQLVKHVIEPDSLTENSKVINNRFKNYIQPTAEEIKECLSDDIKQFLKRTCSKLNSIDIEDVEIDIIDFFIESIEGIRSGEHFAESELTILLCQEIDNLPWNDAKQITQKFLKLVKNMFGANMSYPESVHENSNKLQYVVLQNTSKCCPHNALNPNDSTNFSIEAISNADIDANLDAYMNQLITQIDEWLESLQMQIPLAHDSGLRQVIVHDLARDVVDRHKYLELNSSSRVSDEDGLEHLKYQIFKWINKIAGEDNMDTIEHASGLMQRIQSIPVPMLTRPQQHSTEAGRCCPQKVFQENSVPRAKHVNISQALSKSVNKSKLHLEQSQTMPDIAASCCSSTDLKPFTPSIKKLNADYDDFLKKWVNKIPIPTFTSAEKALAEKARLGIYNGIWKAITKLKFNPETFYNIFYYEDALDDEVEELLNTLPKTSELETMKHLLKVQLIEKTTNTNELIKSTIAPASFRQQLVENVLNSFPPRTATKEDNKQSHEELQVLKLVEDYILCANYKDFDKAKANIYRKKLIQEAQTLVNNLKKSHGKELQDFNTDLYINSIFHALHKVPLPNEETIKDEAEVIMLGAEVEQWMLDVPLIQNDDGNEQLLRRRLKDVLVTRIREIEKEVNIFDCSGERALKHEISSFLEKNTVQQRESVNISFIAEEFANRIKNRAKQLQPGTTRKSVAFMDSVGYYEFSQNMPQCSSFSDLPGAQPAVANQSSYMIREGTKVQDPHAYNNYAASFLPPHVPLPSEEYFTLEDSQAPPNQKQLQMQPQQIQASIPAVTLNETIDQSVTSNVQTYHDTFRDQTVPSIEFIDRSQNPCCKSASKITVCQPIMQGLNQSVQVPRVSIKDQFLFVPQSIPSSDVPLKAQTSCSSRNQSGSQRIVSSDQPSDGSPILTSMIKPEGVVEVGQWPQMDHRRSVPSAQSGSFRADEQPVEQIRENGIPDQMSAYGPPQGYSTPQQAITQDSPPRPGRKKARSSLRNRINLERRRLELQNDSEDGFESEVDGPCHCMERMLRFRRPPVCLAYEDIEIDQCYPVPFGSLPSVTNNFTLQLCSDVLLRSKLGNQELNEANSFRNIKSVQTSFSSVNMATTQKCNNYHRKIKSQEDLHNNDSDIQIQNDALDLLKKIYNSGFNKKWCEKMQRLAQKLAKTEDEDRIRQKIQKYLRQVPSPFSEHEKDSQDITDDLPDSIINKLKNIYFKLEKRRKCSSSVRILRIEIPKENCDKEDTFKHVIENWLKSIPIKKRDFFGRGITKEDVKKSVVVQLEPYVLNRHNYDKDYKSLIKSKIFEILNEMPIEIDDTDKISYYDWLVSSLVNEIVGMHSVEHHAETSNRDIHNNFLNVQKLEEFVSNRIDDIINKLHLVANTKQLKLLKEKLKGTLLVEVTNLKANKLSDATKNNVFTILHELGGLSDYQADYFTYVILKHFKEEFNEKVPEENNTTDLRDTNAIEGHLYSNTYTVFHNAKAKSKVSNENSMNTNLKDLTINDKIKCDIAFYKSRLIAEIKEWLSELHIKTTLESSEKAVNDLAEDIIDRFKYIELISSNKVPRENEVQYLKYQIFKWINKIAGENTVETIEHANELMNRIQCIAAPDLLKPEEEKHKSSSLPNIKVLKDNERHSQPKKVNIHRLQNITNAINDVSNQSEMIDDLALNVIKQIELGTNNDTVIKNEIESWMKSVYKGNHKVVVKDKLKQSLTNILNSRDFLNIDFKKEKILIRKYQDIIDEWIDNFVKTSKEIFNFKDRNQQTHDLAVQFYVALHNKVSKPKKYMEEVTLEWVQNSMGHKTIRRECVCKLVNSVLDNNNERLLELNQINHDKTFNSNQCKIDNSSNTKPSLEQKGDNIRKYERRAPSDLAVYGVTLPSHSKAENKSFSDGSIKAINYDDVHASLDLYLKQLVEQIDDWLGTLDIPQIHDKGFREIVINDLAGDIIDRHQFLELNPSSRGSDENELDQLKYQIFKSINKLVGENQQETVEHALDLMNRIQCIPIPILTKHSETFPKKSFKVTTRSIDGGIAKVKSAIPSNIRLRSPLGVSTEPMASSMASSKRNIFQGPPLVQQITRSSLPANSNVNDDTRLSESPALEIPKIQRQAKLPTFSEDRENMLQGMSLDEIHQYYNTIFQERLNEIPLDTPTPEQGILAELAKKGIHNGIWKTYFNLKADPDIENDYPCFEMVFEDRLDKMLDCLPQTDEVQKIRQVWKTKVLSDVLCMLKYVHSMTDRPSFRELIIQKFNRQYLRAYNLKSSNLQQQQYVECVAKNYILHTKFIEEDPVKANIYRQRLMKKVGELAESVKAVNNVDFRLINQAQLSQMAMQLLASVPIPHDETLSDEVEEILIGEEIDQWYTGLPVKPVCNETDADLRNRMKELLARKLYKIEKQIGLDESAEQNLRYEVSKFLQEKAELQKNVDLEINFMVEELINRLKNRRQQNSLGYESFVKEKPVSSTFVQTDPSEVLAPLVDAGVNAKILNMLEFSEVSVLQGTSNNSPQMAQGQSALGTSQVAGPSNQNPLYQPIGQVLPPCFQGQGVLDTSQVAYLKNQVPFQQQNEKIPLSCCHGQAYLKTNQLDRSPYQQRIGQQEQPFHQGVLGIRQPTVPNQSFASIERFGNQSYHVRHAPNKSINPSNVVQYAPNILLSQTNAGQIQQGSVLAPGQAVTSNIPLPINFFTTQDQTPTAATRSTAREASCVPELDYKDEEPDVEEEIRYKCRCMERVWKCKKPKYYEDKGRHPRFYPMPYPCRYFY